MGADSHSDLCFCVEQQTSGRSPVVDAGGSRPTNSVVASRKDWQPVDGETGRASRGRVNV